MLVRLENVFGVIVAATEAKGFALAAPVTMARKAAVFGLGGGNDEGPPMSGVRPVPGVRPVRKEV